MENPKQAPPPASGSDRFIPKLKHSRWRMLAPLGLIVLASFSGNIVRALCLIGAVVISIWIVHDTEFAKGTEIARHSRRKHISRTVGASLVLVIAAVGIFWVSNRIEVFAQNWGKGDTSTANDQTKKQGSTEANNVSNTQPVQQPQPSIPNNSATGANKQTTKKKIRIHPKTAAEITKPASQLQSVQPATPPPQQDNSVHVESGASINQESKGPCSPNIIGGSPTVNCAPPPTIQSVIMGMGFICTPRQGVALPDAHMLLNVASLAGVILKKSSGDSLWLEFAKDWQAIPADGKVQVIQQYILPPDSDIIGQPVTALNDITEADIKAIWVGGDWCSDYEGYFSMKVNGEFVWKRHLETQSPPTEQTVTMDM